jgi:hypothetical protein
VRSEGSRHSSPRPAVSGSLYFLSSLRGLFIHRCRAHPRACGPFGFAQGRLRAVFFSSFGATARAAATRGFATGTSFTPSGGFRAAASAASAWTGVGGGALRPGSSGPPGQPGAAVPTFVRLSGVGVPVFGGRTNASVPTRVGVLGFCNAACFCWA